MALGVMCLCYSHHQTSGWLIQTKMVAGKPICYEIFCFNLHGQTLIFCCKSLTVKFDVKYLFTTWFLETITFVFMMSQSSSDKKHINMWYQIASGTSNQRAKFVGFILQNCAVKLHCVKNVQIWSYFWSVFSCVRNEYQKKRTKKIRIWTLFTQC